MTSPADIVFASGAIHDDVGPITAFAAMTDAGRDWIKSYGTDGSYVIEDHLVEIALASIADDDLTVAAA